MCLLRFVTWGRGGGSETLLRNENKIVNKLKDIREENDERNDCLSRKITGIRAIEKQLDFFKIVDRNVKRSRQLV